MAREFPRWKIHKVWRHELSSTEAAGNVGHLDFSMGGSFHLFYLENFGSRSTQVGHWVGQDLLHWEERQSIPVITGKPGDWNAEGPILTGMVVHREGKFYLYAGATREGVELTGVFISDDLDVWSPYHGNPVFRPAAPHYLDRPVPPFFSNKLDFRDPFIFSARRPPLSCAAARPSAAVESRAHRSSVCPYAIGRPAQLGTSAAGRRAYRQV